MKLKSLEIKGFKSFADKTVVNFDVGITDIRGRTVLRGAISVTVFDDWLEHMMLQHLREEREEYS